MAMIATSAYSQDEQGKHRQLTSEQRVELRIKHLAEKLSLSDDQVKKVKEVFTAAEKSRMGNHDERTESRKKIQEEMEKILTPDQLAKWKEIQEQQKQRMMEKRGQGNSDQEK